MNPYDHFDSYNETAELKGRPTTAEIERRVAAAHDPFRQASEEVPAP